MPSKEIFMATTKRPVLVTSLGIFGLFGSIIYALMGLGILLDENRVTDFASTNLTNGGLLWLGGISLAVAALGVYLASSILTVQKWARLWYTVVAAANIISGFWFLIHHSGDQQWSGVTVTVLWIITLVLLYNDKADAYFED